MEENELLGRLVQLSQRISVQQDTIAELKEKISRDKEEIKKELSDELKREKYDAIISWGVLIFIGFSLCWVAYSWSAC